MRGRKTGRVIFLVLAALLTLLTTTPVADVPVKVYDSVSALVPVFAMAAVVCAWISLALSERRRRDLAAAFVLNLLAVLFLCRALGDLGACYSYCVTG